MTKKLSLLFALMLSTLMASAHDIEVQNGDGVTIYYNYFNNGTELAVTYRGTSALSYINEYTGDVVIPEEVTFMNRTRKVTSIGNYAFYYCQNLTSITIGNSVTSIGSGAFEYCSGLKKVIVPDIAAWCGINFGTDSSNPLYEANHLYSDENTEITNLVIPNGVTSIGNYAFLNCAYLTSVTIGNSVTSIGDYAFILCSGLTSVTIPNSVTSIGYHAFHYCSGLTSITIPNSVTSIGSRAFEYCSGLTSIIVDGGNSIYDSRGNCNAINKTATNTLIVGCKTTIIPNSVTSIGDDAFSGCSGLTSITIPNSVTSIGEYAFEHCSKLTSITIPNSVTSIGYGAFWSCSGLTSVTIPNSVTSIEQFAFYGCFGLTSITIPNTVTSIGSFAFDSCSKLTSVTIPNSVTSIGESAFGRVDFPTVVSLIENPFAITGKTSNYKTFSQNTFNNATLYVPKGTIDKYKATDGWKDFFFIEEGNPTGINAVEKTSNNNTTIYDLNGIRQSEAKKGINIINGKKVVMK